MARVGDVVVNQATGERIVFRRIGSDVLEMDDFWPVGHAVAEHVHPEMEERWLVVSGEPCFRIDGVERHAKPGERVIAPAGVAHSSWNAGDGPVHLRIQIWPGLRWASFVERLFAGEDPLKLMREFPREIALP
jgi:mannose-6-phosphate isomerase-like protein (cupin superfamily)